MRVSVEWPGYNWRRYSRPWIARVVKWPVGGRAELQWGTYLGGENGGELEIEAEPGDVVRYGQKDARKPKHSIALWCVVTEGGNLEVIDEARAARQFRIVAPVAREFAAAEAAAAGVTPIRKKAGA